MFLPPRLTESQKNKNVADSFLNDSAIKVTTLVVTAFYFYWLKVVEVMRFSLIENRVRDNIKISKIEKMAQYWHFLQPTTLLKPFVEGQKNDIYWTIPRFVPKIRSMISFNKHHCSTWNKKRGFA